MVNEQAPGGASTQIEQALLAAAQGLAKEFGNTDRDKESHLQAIAQSSDILREVIRQGIEKAIQEFIESITPESRPKREDLPVEEQKRRSTEKKNRINLTRVMDKLVRV